MASDLAKHARREAKELEQELDKIPAFRKWKLAVALATEYEAEASKSSRPEPKTVAADIPRGVVLSASEQIQQAGIAFLRKHGKRAKAREIYDGIRELNLPIKGADPVATVAAHMSNAKGHVDNVRGEGYGLKEWSPDAFDTILGVTH